jgi:hypothetical protein
MQGAGPITVRMFGLLHGWRRERDLPTTVEADVAADGESARAIAERLALPVEMIEAVFVNGFIRPLDEVVHPGDRIAYVPYGTPGPHRVYLGIYAAGRASHHGADAEPEPEPDGED